MRKTSSLIDPTVTIEQWTQRSKDEKGAYRDLFHSVWKQLNTYSDMCGDGGSILEDMRTWEVILSNKSLNSNTLEIVRTSLQFQHNLNVAFGRLATSLSTSVAAKTEIYAKENLKESKLKDDAKLFLLMQKSEERFIATMENYWKSYVEFFRHGYQIALNIKNFFVQFHPEDPVFVAVPKAFGKDLQAIWEDETELRITMYILKYFEEYGCLDENVFKNNVPPEAVKNIVQALGKGTIPLTGSSEAMAHVLLHWASSLPESIFTYTQQKEFLEVGNMVNMQAKKERMAVLIKSLPRQNRIVLLAILRGCVKAAREKSVGNSRYTQIMLENVAEIASALGPALVRCTPEQLPVAQALLRYLILNSELFFPLACDEERSFAAESTKLGKIMKLAAELPPSPATPSVSSSSFASSPSHSSFSFSSPSHLSPSHSSPSHSSLSFSDTSGSKLMKIGERFSAKKTVPPPSPSFPFSLSQPTATTPPPSTSFLSASRAPISSSHDPSVSSRQVASLPRSFSDYITRPPVPPSDPPSISDLGKIEDSATSSPAQAMSIPVVVTNSSPTSPRSIPPRQGSFVGIGLRPTTPLMPSSAPTSPLSSSPAASVSPPLSPRKKDEKTNDEYETTLARLELGPLGSPAHTATQPESAQKLARDVITKVETIQRKSESSTIFDEAFGYVLKLKIVVKDVETIKSQLQLAAEFDKSELTKSHADKLVRVRTTVQVFSREIIYVMETVIAIFNVSEIPPEVRTTVGACLSRISSQLGNP